MRFGLAIVLLLIVVGAIVAGVRVLTRRREDQTGGDIDLIPYGLLAISVGITVFALAQLGRAAFPGESLVGSANQRVATALAGLVVGAPFAFILWRRQAERRKRSPESAGWPIYLAVAEAALTTSLVVVLVQLLNWLLLDDVRSSWTDVLVLGAAFAFHEWAAREDATGSDIAGLPRVIGSAIGLIAASIGLGGLLWGLLESLYGTLFATAGRLDIGESLILLLVGLPLWIHRWLRPWPRPPAMPRKTWLVFTSVAGLSTAIGAVVAIVIATVAFLVGDTAPAARHFEILPGAISVGGVALLIWAHHLGRVEAIADSRENTLRSYEYIMTALGLSFTVGSLTALSAVAFGSDDLVDTDRPEVIVAATIVALAAVAVWSWFWSRCQAADRVTESVSQPRRVYVMGMAVVAGLVAAQALIATLVVVFQIVLGLDTSRLTLATEGALAVFATVATLHLIQVNRDDKALHERAEVVAPYQVTIICSHPGQVSTRFPKTAKVRVFYRQDDVGVVSDEMAEAIVEAVGNRDSLVWVRDGTFEVAPARPR
jgi:hypothetical protein